MVVLQHAGSSLRVPGIATKPAACMTSTFDWRYRMVAKSMSGGRRRMTSDIRICHLLLTMRSSGQAGDFRITRGAWREWSKATKVNPSGLSCGSTPPVNLDSFDQTMATRFISIETALLTERFPNWPLALGWCLPMRSAKRARRPPRSNCSGNTGCGPDRLVCWRTLPVLRRGSPICRRPGLHAATLKKPAVCAVTNSLPSADRPGDQIVVDCTNTKGGFGGNLDGLPFSCGFGDAPEVHDARIDGHIQHRRMRPRLLLQVRQYLFANLCVEVTTAILQYFLDVAFG